MDNKHQMGSEDLASPGTHGFRDWASKPSKETKETKETKEQPKEPKEPTTGRHERQLPDDPNMATHLCEVRPTLFCALHPRTS